MKPISLKDMTLQQLRARSAKYMHSGTIAQYNNQKQFNQQYSEKEIARPENGQRG